MWGKTLPMKHGPYIIIQKKKTKGIYGKATKEQVKELNEEGIEIQTIPWIEDKAN